MIHIPIAPADLQRMVALGLPDATIARWRGCSVATVIKRRLELGLRKPRGRKPRRGTKQ